MAGLDAVRGVEKAVGGKPGDALRSIERARQVDAADYLRRAVSAPSEAALAGASLHGGGWMPGADNPLTAVGLGGAAYMSLAAALLGGGQLAAARRAVARTAGDAARFAAPFLDASTAVPAVSRALASVLGETPDYRDGGLAAALAR